MVGEGRGIRGDFIPGPLTGSMPKGGSRLGALMLPELAWGYWRRKAWLLDGLTPRKAANLCLAGTEYLAKREVLRAWPVIVKIDISPLCNLRCTVCVHAVPHQISYLEKQRFHADQKMSVAQFRRIIDEIKGKATAVGLHYLGDPLIHPDLDEMCSIARQADLNDHGGTNFSFPWTDERIRRHAESGVTHLTVCVDGLSQEKYGRTRVGGRIALVLSNLERLCRYKKERRLRYPWVEVQYLVFEHNRDEMQPALELFKRLDVDQVCFKEGSQRNWASLVPRVQGPMSPGWRPFCEWPYFFMVVKYNGDVIPCCLRRLGEQYSATDNPRVLGNVFQTTLQEVWNSPAYRQIRRMCANPPQQEAVPGTSNGFCHGCGRLYDVVQESLDAHASDVSPSRQVYGPVL